jgi:predicted transposase/invertase (TIGR01784 family)
LKLAGGEQVDIEMQSQQHPALRERRLYYWARLYAGQLGRGDEYLALRRCVLILFTNFNLLPERRFHSIFQLQELHSSQPFTEHLQLHLVELPKFEDVSDKNDEPNLALWSKFLRATTDAALEELAMQYPVLKQAKQALDELSEDPQARLRAEQREMALISYHLGLGRAREDGVAEGETRGRAAAKVDAVLTVLRVRGIGLSAEQRHQLESSGDLAALEGWLTRAVSVASADELFAP